MFVDRYVPKTNQRFILLKLMVGFQFLFKRFNGVEKIVDEKNDNIHPSIHPHRPNEKIALFGLWKRPHVLFGKTASRAKIQLK